MLSIIKKGCDCASEGGLFSLLSNYSWQFLTVCVFSFSLCIFGSLVGYLIRRRRDKRRVACSLLLGDIAMGLLIGIGIFSAAVYYQKIILYGEFKDWLEKTIVIGGIMFLGAAFAPKLIAKIEAWIDNLDSEKLISIIKILTGRTSKDDSKP